MPKGKRGSRGKRKSERYEIHYGGRVHPSILRGRDPRAVLAEAWQRYTDEGEETSGVHLIGKWRNPDNKNPKHSNWKTTDDEGQTLEKFHTSATERVGITGDRFTASTFTVKNPEALKPRDPKRSAAAKRGAVTRREQAALAKRLAESLKRSKAAKKGAATKAKMKFEG